MIASRLALLANYAIRSEVDKVPSISFYMTQSRNHNATSAKLDMLRRRAPAAHFRSIPFFRLRYWNFPVRPIKESN